MGNLWIENNAFSPLLQNCIGPLNISRETARNPKKWAPTNLNPHPLLCKLTNNILLWFSEALLADTTQTKHYRWGLLSFETISKVSRQIDEEYWNNNYFRSAISLAGSALPTGLVHCSADKSERINAREKYFNWTLFFIDLIGYSPLLGYESHATSQTHRHRHECFFMILNAVFFSQ